MYKALTQWLNRFGSGALLLPLAVFIGLISIVHLVIDSQKQQMVHRYKSEVMQTALLKLTRLDAELSANVYLANGLVAFIGGDTQPLDEHFRQALKALFQQGRNLRSLAVAPNNMIAYVHPLEGNEKAIGFYYPDNAEQWASVQQAIDQRQTILAGPVALRQGGYGIISRTPVFLSNGKYWGMLSLVLNIDGLLASAGIDEEVDGMAYALRGKDAKGEQGEVFFGEASLFHSDSLKLNLSVAGGSWQLAVRPIGGWQVNQGILDFAEFSLILLSALLAWMIFGYQNARLAIVDSERRLRTFLETTKDGVIVIDEQGEVQEFNPAAEQLFGFSSEEMLGHSVNRLMPPDEASMHDRYIRQPVAETVRTMAAGRQVMGQRKDGSQFPIEITVGSALVGRSRLHIATIRDVSERLAYEKMLVELATTDPLTGAFNRRAFMERAQTLLKLSQRSQQALSVMLIDADHFKRVNDSHGHGEGDRVLVELVSAIKQTLRATDILARFGGEEFVVLLPETSCQEASEVAERLLNAVRSREIQTPAGETIRFTVSIGISCVRNDETDIDPVLSRADAELYHAKLGGRDRWSATPGN